MFVEIDPKREKLTLASGGRESYYFLMNNNLSIYIIGWLLGNITVTTREVNKSSQEIVMYFSVKPHIGTFTFLFVYKRDMW